MAGQLATAYSIDMNKHGNPKTLVAAHPGNRNALKYGVYSPGLIDLRSAEIVAELTSSFQFSVTQRVAVREFARRVAILHAIDADLSARGIVDKRGEPRTLLRYRSQVARELDHWLSKIAPTIERQTAESESSPRPGRSEFEAELRRIALGGDTSAGARERVAALKELLRRIDLEPEQVTQIMINVPVDEDGRPFFDEPVPPLEIDWT